MSLITDQKLQTRFNVAIEEIKKLDSMSNDDKGYFYARYKQATVGDNPQKESPSFFDFMGKAKWNAWNTCLGMSADQAAREYIEHASKLVGRGL
jgi:diazepam-binding inhibitor (GABA receptor modulating acyl-CoA-binding protein)